ncbi:MAG: hypothetical protein IK062_04215 [Selenomonadaceae bacterium]|nr:hypothetical protein [Selenomonadaceae bacterium]
MQLYEEVKSVKNVMGIAKRNCYYLKNSKIDKYRELRIKIREIFEKNAKLKLSERENTIRTKGK